MGNSGDNSSSVRADHTRCASKKYPAEKPPGQAVLIMQHPRVAELF